MSNCLFDNGLIDTHTHTLISCIGKTLPESERPLPELLVREEMFVDQDSKFTFYFLKEKKAFSVDKLPPRWYELFRRNKVLWMIEPGFTLKPVGCRKPNIPILTTVSPDPIRYKEFTKDVANKLYMKPYTLNELLTIGNHMLPTLSSELKDLYTPEHITQRFHKYGGIIRRVLPGSIGAIDDNEEELKKAIASTNDVPNIISQVQSQWNSIELTELGSYLVQWSPLLTIGNPIVPNEEDIIDITFSKSVSQFASEYVKNQVQTYLQQVSHIELRNSLDSEEGPA